ncbi:MAG TPA: hypothetical protein DEA27_04005, partial [Candidatus Moranbacteria bacterium]|nr:hypothetical protein [Candidatus Moranbacteria bacterium]
MEKPQSLTGAINELVKKHPENNETMEKLFKTLVENFEISRSEQLEIIEKLHTEMDMGLAGETSSLKMIPSFVEPPKGYEVGKYLVLDLGGTNFRVIAVDLEKNGNITEPQIENNTINKEILAGTKDELFDYISDVLANFITKNNLDNSGEQMLGFTFSFPIEQTSLTSGKLISWTKGFSISGVVGEDVVELLNESMRKKGIKNIKIVSLVNDTVGTLAHGRYKDEDCDTGVILGTGTNAAYIEDISKIKTYNALHGSIGGKMIINMEWGNFNKLPRTNYDEQLDATTENQGWHIMEKMVSAKYIAELTKIIVRDFVSKNVFSANMNGWDKIQSFSAQDMSEIICDNSSELELVEEKMRKFEVTNTSLNDRLLLKSICKSVFDRSARIAATLIAGVILKMDPELNRPHTVAIDGSLYEKATGYKESLADNIYRLLGKKEDQVKLILSKDGSGIGAAV